MNLIGILGTRVPGLLATTAATLCRRVCHTKFVLLAMKPRLQSDAPLLRRWLAVFCIVVMAVFGFVQAVHVHDGLAADESPSTPAAHCLICVAAHSATVVTAISLAPVLATSASVTPVLDPQVHSQLVVFTTFIRPPPQLL